MCLAGAVVASWSLTQEVAGSGPFTVMTNIFVTEFSETFRKNSINKLVELRSYFHFSGGSRIFLRGVPTPKVGVLTKLPKQHENERIWTLRGCSPG